MCSPRALLLFCVLLKSAWGAPTVSASKCGYGSCPATKPGMLNVHILAHTHMDLGWLKTVDQYYFGSKNYIANAGVQYIFDSVLVPLEDDPSKRFIFVETGFFDKWWTHRNETTRSRFNKLVQSGQMEFISGGWVMSDEACSHYSNTIDQMTYGLRRLKDVFGDCGIPRIGWQIDPFGHSREYASLLAQMDMDGYFFGRLDYQDKDHRETNKEMEFIWQASANLGKAAEILTGILPNTYSPPPGFCFDIFCDDEPIIDDPHTAEYNVDARVAQFLDYAKNESAFYKTNNIPVTMGNDFNYQSAPHWFDNLDKLIRYVNAKQASGSKVNLLYSTPSCYLKALRESGATWPTKSDDFFPYASDPHAYWSGYFTSRPAFKFFDRYGNNIFQAVKQLAVLAHLDAAELNKMGLLRESLSVAQHHDAVSGTAKQAVNDDYVKHLYRGLVDIKETVYTALQNLTGQGKETVAPRFTFCHTLNISACTVTETGDTVAVIVYNPQAKPVDAYVTIPTVTSLPTVHDAKGNIVDSQALTIPKGVKNIPERASSANYEITFKASLPPLGFQTYFVEMNESVKADHGSSSRHETTLRRLNSAGDDVVLKGKKVAAIIDGTTGLLKQLQYGSVSVNVKQSFYYYKGMAGDNENFDRRASGAYIFRPNGTEPIPVGQKVELDVSEASGSLVKEVRQTFSDWLTQVIRVYEDEDFVEFDWVVGSIPIGDGIGKEVITRFDTDLSTDGVFYTDSNGREILKRKKDSRPTWQVKLHEPVAGNYYPVNSRIFLKDEEKKVQFTVLTDRSHGGSSLRNGSVELMVHRRLLYDDAFGVGEALNETYYNGKGIVVRGRHRVLLSTIDEAAQLHRQLAQKLYMAPVPAFARIESVKSYLSKYKASFSGTSSPLPPNVHLLSFEQWKEGLVLLRLEHFYEKGDNAGSLSAPATVSLQSLFTETIMDVYEMNLAVTKPQKNKGNALDDLVPVKVKSGWSIVLTPMQIRTFIVELPSYRGS
ncbi:lysosomal alpha-mannosidase-like isoform X2 [Ornithodoros turicata]|uniref:lysosomal alpha-mannosidase-like isoform X2 n=1 Tax=Ornithodoros turicata TaxID=34597 RepID=UPI003138D330